MGQSGLLYKGVKMTHLPSYAGTSSFTSFSVSATGTGQAFFSQYTLYLINWTGTDWLVNGTFTSGAFYPDIAGYFLVTGGFALQSDNISLTISKNGLPQHSTHASANNTVISSLVHLDIGDYVSLYGNKTTLNDGGADGAAGVSWFRGTLVGR